MDIKKGIKRFGITGIVVSVITSAALIVLDAVGRLQTARDLFNNRGAVMHWIGAFLLTPWASLMGGLACLAAFVWLHVRERRAGIVFSQAFMQYAEAVEGAEGSVTTITMAVVNQGRPTAIGSWEAFVTPFGGAEVEGILMDPRPVQSTITGVGVTVYKPENFHNGNLEIIPTGGVRNGVLMIVTPKGMKDDLNKLGTRVRIVAHDTFGRAHAHIFTASRRHAPK
jgi:hypothetical protein